VSTIEQQATGTDQHTEPDMSAAVEADPAMFCMLTRITRRIKDWWTDRLMIKTGSHSHALSHTRPAGPPKPLVRWDFAHWSLPQARSGQAGP
jgi:hypothetical protein